MRTKLGPLHTLLLLPIFTVAVACGDRTPELAAPPPVVSAAIKPTPSEPAPAAQQTITKAVREALTPDVLETVTGPASYYADKFEGRRTASGLRFRQKEMFAAHRKYPFGTVLRVTNLSNDKSVTVRVVDRGPFARPKRAQRPVLDVSRSAAERLGFVRAGKTRVRIEVLEWGNGSRRG